MFGRVAGNSVRPGIAAAAVAVVALAIVLIWSMNGRAPDGGAPPPADSAEPGPSDDTSSTRDPASSQALAPADSVPYIEGLVYGDIDLREARAAMPDNLYWQFGAPTRDEEVLAARDEEKKLRNEQYGRVLAGDADEEEVRQYYDYRRRMSEDYYEFAEFMHRRHADNPDDRFVGMLELAMKMHLAKLAEIPREEERALEHARKAELARQDWERQKEEFGEP
jgi:hypothetical protein